VDLADLDPDPLVQLSHWLDDGAAAGIHEPSAVVLATADEQGRPSARHVLLKGLDADGLVFYTNYESRKGREIAANPEVCLLFHWLTLGRQVTVLGPAARVSAEESDAYFASRDRSSQLGAWASRQSEPLATREELEAKFEALDREHAGRPVPRPPHWGGYRVTPRSVELWHSRPNRLHDRIRFDRDGPGEPWVPVRLNP
jgi:pyridoxamine 5'-phosphate oxidase